MKGRTLRYWLGREHAITMPMNDGQVDGYLQSKLLSARGCDIVDYSKDDRSAIIPFEDCDDLEESPPGNSQAQLALDLEAYDEICSSTGGSREAGDAG